MASTCRKCGQKGAGSDGLCAACRVQEASSSTMRQVYIVTGAVFVWVFLYGIVFFLLWQEDALLPISSVSPSALPWGLIAAGIIPLIGAMYTAARAQRAKDRGSIVRMVALSAGLGEAPSFFGFLGSLFTSAPVFVALGILLSLVAFGTLGACLPGIGRRVVVVVGEPDTQEL